MMEAVRDYSAWAAAKNRTDPAPPLPTILANALNLDLRLKPHEHDMSDASWLHDLTTAKRIWEEAHRPVREQQQKAQETAEVSQEMDARLGAMLRQQRAGKVG